MRKMVLLCALSVMLTVSHALAASNPADGVADSTAATCTVTVMSGSNIQDAIDGANNGDTICIGAGIYNEALVIEKNVNLLGDQNPVITRNMIIRNGADGASVSGFKFDLYGQCNEVAIGIRTGVNNISIENNKFYRAHLGGVDIEAGNPHVPNENITIRGNYFEKIPTAMSIVGKNHLVENNVVVHGTQTVPHPSKGQCAFVSNLDADGIKFYGQGHTIRYNQFHDMTFYTDATTPVYNAAHDVTFNVGSSFYKPSVADPLLKNSHTDCFQTSSMSWFAQPGQYTNNKTNNIHIYGNYCDAFSIKNLNAGDTSGVMYLEQAQDIHFYNNFTYGLGIGGYGEVSNIHIYNNTMTMRSQFWRELNYQGPGSWNEESEAQPFVSIQSNYPLTIGVYNNIFFDSHHMPVLIYGVNWANANNTANIQNNIAYWRPGAYTSDNGLTSTWHKFNCPNQNEMDGNGNWCTDPLFNNIDQLDFSLHGSSPAIDYATAFGHSPTEDYYRQSRPQGYAADVGAVEFVVDGNVIDPPANPPPDITTTSLPQGAVGTAFSAQASATGGSVPYTWSLASGSLPDGLSLSSSGEITGAPTTAGTFSFSLAVLDSNGKSDSQTVSMTVVAAPVVTSSADMALTRFIATSSSVQLGVAAGFNFVLKNSGNDIAKNARFVLPIPSGMSWVSGASECSATATEITCNFGDLANGASRDRYFYLRVAEAGQFTLTGSTVSDTDDDDTANNSVSVSMTVAGDTPEPPASVTQADMKLKTFRITTRSPKVGRAVGFNFMLKNNGSDAASGARFVLPMPANMSWVSGASECVPSATEITCGFGDLANGASRNRYIYLRPSVTGSYTLTGSAMSDTDDGLMSNNDRTLNLSVN